MKWISSLLLVLITNLVQAQGCLQLLDSVQYFESTSQEKSRYYADQLLDQLNAGQCNPDIGIYAIYNNLGLLYWRFKDQLTAKASFGAAVDFEIKRSDSLNASLLEPFYNLAALHQELGHYDSASLYLQGAEAIITNNYGERSVENINHLYRSGTFFRETGDFRKSVAALEKAQQLVSSEGRSDSTKIELLIELGTTYRHFGDLEMGELQLTNAIEIAQEKSKLMYLIALDRLASLKIEQGEYSDSESYLLYNLDLKEQNYANDTYLKLETLNGLGKLYYKLNDLGSADRYIGEALALSKDVRNVEPYMLNNLGTIYMKQGNVDVALDYFHRSAAGFRDLYGSVHPDYASCLNNLAGAEKEKGNFDEALRLYTRVLDMDNVIYGPHHQQYAASLNNIALLYIQLGVTDLAEKLLLDARDVRKESLGDTHPSYVKTLNDLGLVYLLKRDTLKAMQAFDEAIISETHHMRDVFPVLTEKQRQLYYTDAKFAIERFCSLALSESYIDTEWGVKALNHFINAKGALFYASDKMRKIVQSSDDEEIKAVFEEWREKKYKLAQSYLIS
ncbi:MAG: tetratricopeptide repeat protein, partial [Bacteroidota bacterium]